MRRSLGGRGFSGLEGVRWRNRGKGRESIHIISTSYKNREQSASIHPHIANDTSVNANVGLRSLEQFKQEFIG